MTQLLSSQIELACGLSCGGRERGRVQGGLEDKEESQLDVALEVL